MTWTSNSSDRQQRATHHTGAAVLSNTIRNMDVNCIDFLQRRKKYFEITGTVDDKEGSWYKIFVPDNDVEKLVLKFHTVQVMEEGKPQVRKREGTACQAPRETITESHWWSFRPAHRNEADTNMCLNMDIEHEAMTKTNEGSIKASDGERSKGIQMNMSPTVLAGMEPSGPVVQLPSDPTLPPMGKRSLTLNPPDLRIQ